MSIAHALPEKARQHLVHCLRGAGYTPPPAMRLFGQQESVSAKAARLGAEVTALINWVIDVDSWLLDEDVDAARAAEIALHITIERQGGESAAEAARRWWARRPADVADMMRQAWRIEVGDARADAVEQADAILRAAGLPTHSEALEALHTAYADIQRLPGHTIDMLGRIEASRRDIAEAAA